MTRAEGPSNTVRRRRVGQRLGRYCLGALMGSGGAASVYMARLDGPRGFERVLALKLVHEHLLTDRDFVAMFLDEATLASQLRHPNIVHTYELCQDDDALYLAMEYLQGQPLSRLYQRAHAKQQPLPYGLLAWLGARAADALAYAHDARDAEGERLGLVHRDVSPDNIFVTYEGEVKLLDFGIARAARRLAQTNLGQVKGKLRYMSPEYALGQDFDESLDIFALGATLYEAALGVPAFEGDEQAVMQRIVLGKVNDPRTIRPDFPEPLWDVLSRMLAPEAALRLGPAAAVARALDELAGLTPAQGRGLLSLTLDRLFGDDIAAEARDLSELRSLSRVVEDRTEHGHAVTPSSVRPSSGRRGLGVLTGLVVLSGSLFFSLRNHSTAAPVVASVSPVAATAPAATAPAAAALLATPSVDIAVVVRPAGVANAHIEIAGKQVSAADPHLAVLRDDHPTTVRVSAPGYGPMQVEVAPDRDRSVVLTLTPIAPSAASGRPTTRMEPRPTAAPDGVIKRYPF